MTEEVTEAVEITNEKDEYLCGWGKFNPQYFQKFRNPTIFLIIISFLAITQGMAVNGFVSVVISSIEKRFELTSTHTGLIASGYDIASIICLIPVSYFGGKGHRPHWVVGGIFILSSGSLLFSLPHFLAGEYSYQKASSLVKLCGYENLLNSSNVIPTLDCPKPGEFSSIQATKDTPSRFFIIFFLAHMLHGAGSAPIFTLAVTYLDESLSPKLSPLYLGIFYSTAIIGPALGYILGGQFLKIYVDVLVINMQKYLLFFLKFM